MCKACGKKFHDYTRIRATNEFIKELSRSTGIPVDHLVYSVTTGPNAGRGTWIHPDVAINLGQWLSPIFAVKVSQWIREWMTGKVKPSAELPYHIERYLANRSEIPYTHFSILNEMTLGLIAPLESNGYVLPERMLPDISMGRMFCKWLRDEHDIDTDSFPTYLHRFQDGRVVPAKLYPNKLLGVFRKHFHEKWIPERALKYFGERDKKALPHIEAMLGIEATEKHQIEK